MNRSNLAIALLCLLLGAALADWLSTHDARAQALPPSTGGTSYTHPSSISLSNGIDSQDGGTFNGNSYFDDSVTVDGGLVLTNPTLGNCTLSRGAYSTVILNCALSNDGYTFTTSRVTNNAVANSVAFITSTASARWYLGNSDFFYNDGTNMIFDGMGLNIPDTEWTHLGKIGSGAPTGTDCDSAGEARRTYFDSTNHFQYFCEGAAGWYKSGVYAP